ncbi:type 11 methyltransferase [Oceaniovalibus guishaninsula JLT2003]|uniref:Type 11 methyltransferase n=1 Tax=Oceaniovalibus guishaninsula JLT2003 TaxID=1231392 RepID=K2I5B4_9RHOB|nr:class I SAM-dependent methyltransferase [Oceaniovalibus guishaninsula]EKE44095.1 type 11 methyltransferase [Oceaniovalibus guishaninsula JLT2003]
MSDPETLACYARMAEDYADRFSRGEPDGDLSAFMDALPAGDGPVLDWGCGPGNSAAIMAARGIRAEATDASPEMAAIARDLGIAVRVEPFEDLVWSDPYRGIWANFSLTHAPPDDVPDLIALAARALAPGGVLHLGMKTGTGTDRDRLGRFFSFWNADDLDRMTQGAGLVPFAVRHGRERGLDDVVMPFVIHLSRRPVDG